MAQKVNGTDVLLSDWARAPPKPSGTVCDRIMRCIYNPEEKSVLGRTPKRWGVAFLFYMVFYAVLAALFAVCMGGLFLALDDHRPMFTLDSSLIGANPGVAFRPIPLDGMVVTLDQANSSAADQYVEQLRQYFKQEPWVIEHKECVENDTFGFPDTPCFFIKLNKIFDWEPQYYEVDSLPPEMPSHLVDYIKSLDKSSQKQIWISCEEEKPSENSTISLKYPWTRGLPSTFYPYTNEVGYRSPIVAVKVIGMPVNKMITVRCRAWAKNVIYNKSIKLGTGYARIQLQIIDKNPKVERALE